MSLTFGNRYIIPGISYIIHTLILAGQECPIEISNYTAMVQSFFSGTVTKLRELGTSFTH
jgi:hypothetical protein